MLLEMTDICKDYMQGRESVHILKHIDLRMEEGDFVAIMGPSGSGKSTLMNIIGCLDVPTSGRYFLDGEDVSRADENRLADIRNRTLGFVFQSFNLMPKLSACENVALPLLYAGIGRSKRLKMAREALEKVGLGDRMDFLPTQLSGGQQQRVAIARAMINHPKLLLADEPTGALDSASGEQVIDIFEELNAQGTTVLLITHERSVGLRARKMYFIRDGRMTDREGETDV